MPKAPPPSLLLKFQGRLDWSIEPGIDDWGLTEAQQESYVEQFRRILAAKGAWREDAHDYYTLRRFLRARTYDLEKATTMWLNHLAFRAEWKVDTIMQDFYFGERDKFLHAYPQGYHRTDRVGRPIFIQLLGQLEVNELKRITNDERMIKFHLQEYERCIKVILPICSQLQGRHIDTTFGIMDVKGVGLSHMTGEAKRLLGLVTKYDQDNYPEMLGHICIINAPTVFRMIWNVVKNMLDPRTQGKIEILGTNYMDALLKWVDIENLPDFLGGKSKGTLIDDVGPWSDHETISRLGLDVEDLRHGKHLHGNVLPRGSASLRESYSGRTSGQYTGLAQTSASQFGALPLVGELTRINSNASRDGYQSPMGSSADISSSFRNNTFHHTTGITADILEESQSRYASSNAGQHHPSRPLGSLSQGSSQSGNPIMLEGGGPGSHASSAAGHHHPYHHLPGHSHGSEQGGFAAIPEGMSPAGREQKAHAGSGNGRASTLVERINALEQMIPQQMNRLRAEGGAGGNGAGVMLLNMGATQSTKSAPEGSLLNRVEVLEEALEVLLAAQQASLEQQRQQVAQQERRVEKDGCCCVMM